MAPRKKKDEAKDGHVITLNNKEFITHIGLLDLAHKAGMQGWSTDPIHEWSDPDKDKYAVKARVWDGEGREFTGIGDASPKNLNAMILASAPRMAETRAINRALRALVNHGATTADEMPQVGLDSQPLIEPGNARQHRKGKPTSQPTTVHAPKWSDPFVSRIHGIAGSPSYEEIEEMCKYWSKEMFVPADLPEQRIKKLLDKVESEYGAELLHDIRERAAIKAEGGER